MSHDKSGSPPCGIYIRIDDYSDMVKLITNLRQMALAVNRASGYEKNLDVVELAYSAENDEKIADLVILIQAEGLVALISGLEDFSDIKDADGVLLEDVGLLQDVRNALGKEAIIGLSCGSDRNQAQKAKELDFDFVKLVADPPLISWFSSQSDIMIVTCGKGITNDNCASLVQAGAGFLDVSDYIMGYKKGVMQGTVNVMHAIELATQVKGSVN